MKYLNFTKKTLDEHLKLWIYCKIRDLYKTDPYFGHVDNDILLSSLALALFKASTFDELIAMLDDEYKNGIKITRKIKTDSVLYFEYPSLVFQIKSLVKLWPKFVDIYKGHPKDECSSFGHRPNLIDEDSNLVSTNDRHINSPKKVKFQEQYVDFENHAYGIANDIVKSSVDGSIRAVVVQTDIKSFFHALNLTQLSEYFDRHLKDNFLATYFRELQGYDFSGALPIGWSFSGFVADLLLRNIHKSINANFSALFHKRIGMDIDKRLRKFFPDVKITTELIEYVHKKVAASDIKFESSSSFVDDFIFILSLRQVPIADSTEVGEDAFEKIIVDVAIEVANKIMNDHYGYDSLKFYNLDEGKGKYFSFNHSNIASFKTNFHKFQGFQSYGDDQVGLWAMLDDF